MNRETLAGNWMQIKGLVHTNWGKLTDDDVLRAQGRFESLVGSIQMHYGLTKEKAEAAVDSFLETIEDQKDEAKETIMEKKEEAVKALKDAPSKL